MLTPIEAYRQGYEKGRSDSAGGRLAETTTGMLRDDPGRHFQRGYSDGAAGKPFEPPSSPGPKRRLANGLIPKFSDNPIGWLLGVLIVIELWALWQLITAPFQLVGSLLRSEKPSPWLIVKITITAVLVIALIWWVPHSNKMRGPSNSQTPPGDAVASDSVEEAQGGRVVQGVVTKALRYQGFHLMLTTSEGTDFDVVIEGPMGETSKTKFVEMPPGTIVRDGEVIDDLRMVGFRVRVVCAESDAVAPYCTALSVRRMR